MINKKLKTLAQLRSYPDFQTSSGMVVMKEGKQIVFSILMTQERNFCFVFVLPS